MSNARLVNHNSRKVLLGGLGFRIEFYYRIGKFPGMSSKKEKKAETTSDSDSGPDDRNPPPKRVKTDKVSKSKQESEDSMFQLSKMRFVSVREFRGKVMVDIREYYESDGDLKPGKKGICLNLDQWKALKSHIDNIDEAVKQF